MKSFKVMLVPNKHQRTRLFQFAGTARFAYNWALQKEIDAYEAGEKFISGYDLTKKFTVLKNSGEYPWLKSISSQATFQAVRDCADAYIKFFKKQSLRPRFKSKRRGDFSFYQFLLLFVAVDDSPHGIFFIKQARRREQRSRQRRRRKAQD